MRSFLSITILALSLAPSAWGFDVSPISAELDIAKQRSHLITITSQDKEQIPIRVKAVSWRLTKDGEDIRGDTKDIILFPGQFVLSPDEKRVVRVGARAKSKPDIELSYRILIQQVPVELNDRQGTESGVRLLTAYATAFYIKPQNPRSDVRLQSVDRSDGGLVFKLYNDGNTHTHLYKLTLTLSQDGKTVRFDTDKQLPHFMNENLLAKSERDFSWKWPDDASTAIDLKKPFKAELDFHCESCNNAVTELTYAVP